MFPTWDNFGQKNVPPKQQLETARALKKLLFVSFLSEVSIIIYLNIEMPNSIPLPWPSKSLGPQA